MTQKFENMVAAVAAAKGAREALAQAGATAGAAVAYWEQSKAAQGVVQQVAHEVQGQVVEALAGLVTKCLTAVFGPGAYKMGIELVPSRGKTEVQLYLIDPVTLEKLDPRNACGGGVVDVAAFALRVGAVLLHRPPARRLLVLDEPFKFLSQEYRPAARELLVQLAAEMGFQFIIVTHIPELVVDGGVCIDTEE